MEYIYSNDATQATKKLAYTLKALLNEGKKVLWLVSGGSGADVTVEVSKQLEGVALDNLFVTLSDERYGPVGHPDENWQQLLDKGLSLPGATTYRPLTGADELTTVAAFSAWLEETKASVHYTIGLFGIGADGHTAGIKPHSVAATSSNTAIGYTGPDFERITVSPAFVKTIDEAITQAFGADKHAVIQQLLHDDKKITDQPAQLLKHVPKSTLYADYKEEQ